MPGADRGRSRAIHLPTPSVVETGRFLPKLFFNEVIQFSFYAGLALPQRMDGFCVPNPSLSCRFVPVRSGMIICSLTLAATFKPRHVAASVRKQPIRKVTAGYQRTEVRLIYRTRLIGLLWVSQLVLNKCYREVMNCAISRMKRGEKVDKVG